MFKLLLISFAFYGLIDAGLLPRVSLGDLNEGKIIGGSNANIEDYPYQLSMRYKGKHGCGASIISSRWALSAAHCMDDFTEANLKDLTLVSGTTFRTTGGNVHPIKEFIMHPNYNKTSTDFSYDFALLKVDVKFPVGSEGVAIVKLTEKEPQEGEIAVVTGWGVLHPTVQNLPDHLQKVQLPVVSREICRKNYGDITIGITDKMICAGYFEGGKDTCMGDSGGPLVSTRTGLQIGIVSFGYGCAYPKYPGVYSNIAVVLDWIKENTDVEL